MKAEVFVSFFVFSSLFERPSFTFSNERIQKHKKCPQNGAP